MLCVLRPHRKNTKIFTMYKKQHTFLNYKSITQNILAMSQKPIQLKILFYLIQEIQSTVTIQHILTIYKEKTNTKKYEKYLFLRYYHHSILDFVFIL